MSAGFTVPPPVNPGDSVVVLAPSSDGAATARSVLRLGVDRLEEVYDLNVRVHPTARQSGRHLTPRARAAALHEAFTDPDVRAVFATIGGHDQIRVLPYLDGERIAEHPTRFFGMSDNTVLAAALYDLGVVSFYGGQLLNQIATPGKFPRYSRRYLRRALFQQSLGEWEAAEWWTDDVIDWANPQYEATVPEREATRGWIWATGRGGVQENGIDCGQVDGRVWGGCVEVLSWLLMADQGIPSPGNLSGDVLLLETAEDRPDANRVGWILRSLGERGVLGAVDSIIVGRPQTRNRECEPGVEAREAYRTDQRNAILTQCLRYAPDTPIVFDVNVGHTNPTTPVPIGGRIRITPQNQTITFPGEG